MFGRIIPIAFEMLFKVITRLKKNEVGKKKLKNLNFPVSEAFRGISVGDFWEWQISGKSLVKSFILFKNLCGFLVWKINWFRIFCETMEIFYTSLDEYNNTLYIKDKYINKTQENTTKFFICLLIS